MTDKDIVAHVKRLFDPTVSPGEAFDSLFAMRQKRVAYQEVFNAINRSGKVLDVVDEEPGPQATEFECPGCGVARRSRAYCINPACPEFRRNPVSTAIQEEQNRTETPQAANPKFKDPIPGFGKYRASKKYPKGLKLTEIAAVDPAYLKWMEEEHESAFWREQAAFARIAVSATAPHWQETESTGFFDR